MDIICADGFSGNIYLKAVEGLAAGGREYLNYPGPALLGLRKLLVKPHGSSDSVAIEKSIEFAYRAGLADLNAQIEEAFKNRA